MAEAKEKKKVKKPTALKRIIQSKKRNEQNSQLKSKTKTAIRNFNNSLEKKEPKEILTKKLSLLFSLIDKGVKKKIFKKNKAARMKSQSFSKI